MASTRLAPSSASFSPQGERHPRRARAPSAATARPSATALKCSGTPSASTPSASAPNPTGTNRPRPAGARPRRARGRRERGGPGEADDAGRDERVGDGRRARRSAPVMYIRSAVSSARIAAASVAHSRSIRQPARPDGADDRGEQDEVADGIGEVRRRLQERRAGRALDGGGDGHAREHRGDREAAGEPVQARRPERRADAAADQRDQRDVRARVDREPERVRDRGDGDGVEVRRQRVDEVAHRGGEQADAQRGPGEAVRAARGSRPPGTRTRRRG